MEFTNDELDKVIEHLMLTIPDFDSYMEGCYESVTFLGHLANQDDEVKEASLLNIDLCERYSLSKEDYEKLKVLQDLRKTILNKKPIIVDNEVIKDIRIHSN